MPYKDLEKRKSYHQAYRLGNKDKIKHLNKVYNLKRNYGLTIEDYNSLAEVQNHSCALCKKHKTFFSRGYNLAVDHDHETGEVRGLVCYQCNLTLARGLEYFERAVEYLKTKPVGLDGKDIKQSRREHGNSIVI